MNKMKILGVGSDEYEVMDSKARMVNSVAELKAIDNLEDGDIIRTIGYYSANDGGEGTYLIRTKQETDVEDLGYIHFINDSLVAELIHNGNVNVHQFGAKGDGITNDTTAFINAINKADKINLSKKTYKLTNLVITKNVEINGNEATLIDDTQVSNFIEMNTSSENMKLTLKNITINVPNSNVGIYINKNRLIADKITVRNAKEICIHVVKTDIYGNCKLNNVNCSLSNIGIQLDATDCSISNFNGYNLMTHLKNNAGLTHINTFHGWNFNEIDKDWITGSTLIETKANILGSDIYVDTLENGIKLPNNYPYMSLILTNVSYFLNTSSYPNSQQAPTLLKNVESYKGFVRVNGLIMDSCGWTDSQGNQPKITEKIDDSRITLTNVSYSGFYSKDYKATKTYRDIQANEFTYIDSTYLAWDTRKLKCDEYKRKINLIGNIKTGMPTDKLISEIEFLSNDLLELNHTSIIQAKFVSTSVVGKSYNLDACIKNNHLYVYNNTGNYLGGEGNYGQVVVNIEYDKIQ